MPNTETFNAEGLITGARYRVVYKIGASSVRQFTASFVEVTQSGIYFSARIDGRDVGLLLDPSGILEMYRTNGPARAPERVPEETRVY